MDTFDIKEKKEIIRNVLKDIGEPKSRHMSIARTALEDALLRFDCELRAQGVSLEDEQLMGELNEKTEQNKKQQELPLEDAASA